MRVPGSTYRLQLNAGFGFDDARRLVPYLASLGITDVYASPLLAARAGSPHGYDVIDPTRLNPEIGTEDEFEALSADLRAAGMGLLLDIVPNHMAMSGENPWWMDVLEHGRASRYAAFFDIDWTAPALRGRVLVPILGGQYGEVLEGGQLVLAVTGGGMEVRYHEHRFPIDPGTWGPVLADAADALQAARGSGDPDARTLRRLQRDAERLPPHGRTARASVARRGRDSESLKRRLRDLRERSEAARGAIDDAVAAWGGRPDGEAVWERLDSLIDAQAWLLSHWRAATQEIDYRRFFDISELVSVRMQDPEVFEATHGLILRLAARGRITGLRVDHVDGLWDPQEYLERLQRGLAGARGGPGEGTTRRAAPPFYVAVEKILEEGERLPPAWPAAGTTGYEFLAAAAGLFAAPEGTDELAAFFARFTGIDEPFPELVRRGKRTAMDQLFGSEVGALGTRLQELARRDRHGRDLTLPDLTAALAEVTAALPVYRTYVRGPEVSPADRAFIEAAVERAAETLPPEGQAALAFLRRVLLLASPGRRGWLPFVMRWQQFSGPVMAKGYEDTALYVYTPLVALNDVGTDPGAGAVEPEEFHRRMLERQRRWPASLSTTSTHDTKRSEDVRARIDVLSEIPDRWTSAVERWRRLNRAKRRVAGDAEAPEPAEELLIYQTLAGIWPLHTAEEAEVGERLREYLTKAMREAKVHTTWIDPDEEHERAVHRFARSLLSRSNRRWREEFERLQEVVAVHGAWNGLAQALLKATAPGVPDVYRGAELWDLSLVDPDNRRPVDAALRADLLAGLAKPGGADPAGLVEGWRDGRIKLWTLAAALRRRRDDPELFARGAYLPLRITGERREHVVAFARRYRRRWAVTAVPRLTVALGEGRAPLGEEAWGDTTIRLPAGAPDGWANALTGEAVAADGRAVRAADALAAFPVALLVDA